MRYLLRDGNISELSARKEYLKDTFHLWFTENGFLGSFIVLESFPKFSGDNICIIYGHNSEVANLLKNHWKEIPEKNIFIIACLTKNLNDFVVPCKRTFIAPQEKSEGIKLRLGSEFGFDFDISDIELHLFNNRTESAYEKLTLTFEKINTKK